ncbi:MAG: cytochrome C [Acidobacteria bacterium]|nr:cytochrome C [Acidobacteriota bacterium]
MAYTKNLKLALLGVFGLLAAAWLFSSNLSSAESVAAEGNKLIPEMVLSGEPDDYVGSETCRACHEPQFEKVANTKHGKLGTLAAWKGKVVGCESCHGPGKAHVEGSGDKTKIKILKAMDSKAVSETCLACHAGRESHNNFRRGEHWRNNVGCTDCHSAHGSDPANFKAGSSIFVGDISPQNPGQGTRAMLKSNEQQLCISCHKETKSQFAKPFHHKVLEGTMSCSDCHNPHGGFETKQTKLAVGADAACIKCHSNKQGPFVFEHGPLKLEGCTACHTPHGSSNSKLLKRAQVRQLCFECHTGITEELSPGVPSRHNQAQMREQQCTVCHSAIHGSNSSRLFFR